MLTTNLLTSLNDRQRAAVTHGLGPALVLAGAGSGKTRVLTTRVAWLFEHDPQLTPAEVLLVTFTNKAALEMKSRVAKLTGYDLPLSGTFHSFAVRVLRRYGASLQIDPNFVIYDADDQLSLMKEIYRDNGWNPKTHKPQLALAMISEIKNQLLSVAEYRQAVHNELTQFIANAYEVYERRKQQEGALDFDDLLNYAWKLLSTDSYVRRVYQEQLKYVLIDEYQDTNLVQYQLSQLLAAPQNNLFVVGDFSQSIYAWRGASYKNMLSLQKDFPKITTYHLDQNYRSIQPILTAATQVIRHNTDHPILNLWTENKTEAKLTVFDCETGQQEATQVAREIEKLRTKYHLSDIAILYRTNAQSRAFEEALTRRGIPYRLVGGFKFYERKEVKDLLCYLRLVNHPQETVSLARATKIGKRRLSNFLTWRDEMKAAEREQPPLVLLEEILRVTDYRKLYDPDDPEELVKLENINELLAHASQFESVNNFLENVALVQDDYGPDGRKLQGNQDRDEVTLMSLHSAKGLEFTIVFMVGMEENLLPHSRALFDPTELAEERRLCYVGITRAKEQLYFTHARKRWLYGTVTATARSRFIDDLNPDLLDVQYFEETSRPTYGQTGWRRPTNSWNNRVYASSRQSAPSTTVATKPVRRLDLEDCQLDEVLRGELDVSKFLDS